MSIFQITRASHLNGEICGLYFTTAGSLQSTRNYLPQIKLESHTTISSLCYTTTLRQTFNNPSQNTASQACYTFPLYDGVAISGYTITYGDKTLKGIVQHKETAKETYNAAVERGETAALLESFPAGVFGVTLGNLPAKTDVHVDIVYCGELKHDAAIDGIRYMLPTSIAPRYGEYPGKLLESTAIKKGGVSIVVDVDVNKNAIRKVQSPSHPIAVTLGATSYQNLQAAFNQSRASANLTLGTAELAGDFVLQLLIDDISRPQAILEKHPDLQSRAIMATFVPRFNLETTHPEVVFIADQSGSMGGGNNAALVSALKIFLKSLPIGVHFNIIAFGSRFSVLWPKSQAYNESNMKAAIAFVNTFQAQYGGTEILQPVEAAFEQRLGDIPLEIMLLTDGEIWREEELFELIASQVGKADADARVFTLGVGSQVSHTLVEGVARAGNGFAQFVTQGEETDRKVVRMLKGALYPHLKDQTLEIKYSGDADQSDAASDEDFELVEKVNYGITIDDHSPPEPSKQTSTSGEDASRSADKTILLYDTSADLDSPIKPGTIEDLPAITIPKTIQAPNLLPALFPFNRTTIYLLLDSKTPQKEISSITLRATSPQGPLELAIDVDDTKTSGATIHQLAARKVIQDLEEGRGWLQTAEIDGVPLKESYKNRFGEFVEREAVRIGERYQVAGKWTSFVAVDDSNDKADGRMSEDTGAHKPSNQTDRPFGSKSCAMSSVPRDWSPRGTRGGFMPYSTQTAGGGRGGDHLLSSSSRGSSSGVPSPAAGFSPFVQGYSQQAFSSVSPSSHPAATLAMPETANFGSGLVSMRSSAPEKKKKADFGRSAFRVAQRPADVADSKEECASDDDMGFGLFDSDDKPAFAACTIAAPPPLPAASKESTLHQLIDLQTFCGAWDWNDQLFETVGKSVAFDNDAFATEGVMATALAVAFLESKLAASRDVWEMVVAKAKAWLASESVADVERVVGIAKGLL